MTDQPRERPSEPTRDGSVERPAVQGPGPDIDVDELLDEGDLPGRPTTRADDDEDAEGRSADG